MSNEVVYQYRWVDRNLTLQEFAQLLIDRVALLESRVRELETERDSDMDEQ